MKAKKFLSIFFALLLAGTMSASVFAAGSGANNKDVTGEGTITDGTQAIEVGVAADFKEAAKSYSVNITWTNMSFTYEVAAPTGWQPTSHSYQSDSATGAWSNGGSGTVTVTNHSNCAVKVDITKSDESLSGDAAGVTVTMDDVTNKNLASGTDLSHNTYETADKVEATVSVTGAPSKSFDSTKAATITVTISDADGE